MICQYNGHSWIDPSVPSSESTVTGTEPVSKVQTGFPRTRGRVILQSIPLSLFVTYQAPGESDLPWPLKKSMSTQKTAEEFWCSLVPGRRKCKHTGTEGHCPFPRAVLEVSHQLKHVQDGVVHLDQHSQVDGQAGLAVLGGRGARQPGEGVVLFQYKPEHIRGGLRV